MLEETCCVMSFISQRLQSHLFSLSSASFLSLHFVKWNSNCMNNVSFQLHAHHHSYKRRKQIDRETSSFIGRLHIALSTHNASCCCLILGSGSHDADEDPCFQEFCFFKPSLNDQYLPRKKPPGVRLCRTGVNAPERVENQHREQVKTNPHLSNGRLSAALPRIL